MKAFNSSPKPKTNLLSNSTNSIFQKRNFTNFKKNSNINIQNQFLNSKIKINNLKPAPALSSISYLSKINNKNQRDYATSKSEESLYLGAPKAQFTTKMNFIDRNSEILPVYRITNAQGEIIDPNQFPTELTNDKVVAIYRQMVLLNQMDTILYDVQRQGRVSFYMTNYGEEASHFGSAAALQNDDPIYAQYREAGVLMYRGFSLDDFMNQCFSTKYDLGKGRQMPVHYGSSKLNFQTISSPLATQIPQAVGIGYSLKLAGKKNICICYFGEGAASEGDFHAALNFAATLGSPTVFFCRNNGYAISTPTRDQYKGDGIAARGLGYGIHTIRVDGNDLFAVYNATKAARKLSIENSVPVLIEAMTYRGGHHSTSDDASRYRTDDELTYWRKEQNPITRLRTFLQKRNLWNEDLEKKEIETARSQVLESLDRAEKQEKPSVNELFTDVYDKMPKSLEEQKAALEQHMSLYPEEYTTNHH